MAGEEQPAMPTHLTAVEELNDEGRVRLPRGAIDDIRSTLHLCRLKPEWEDRRTFGSPLDVSLHGITPRDYQREGAELLRRKVQGLVVLPCGGGKTYLGITAIAAIGVTTLVVVPTRLLVDQWAEDVRNVLHFEPAIFGSGKHNIGPLTIATADALIYHRDLDLSSFGMAIYDECHRVPSRTRMRLMARLPARYRLGLTATPDREDGQTKLIRWSFGEVLMEKSVEELVDLGFLHLPRVDAVHTSFDYNFPEDPHWLDFDRLNKALVKNEQRNQLIVDMVKSEPNGRWLLLSPSSKEHPELLARALRQRGVKAMHATSDTGAAERRWVMQLFKDGDIQALAATSLADEGFDVKHLGRVVLALPEGAKGKTAQRIGRSMRPYGDAPIIKDLVDRNVDVLLSRWRKRKTVYRKLGLEICECPTLNLFPEAAASH
jgi:superfamily II DNA or RNA helicase